MVEEKKNNFNCHTSRKKTLERKNKTVSISHVEENSGRGKNTIQFSHNEKKIQERKKQDNFNFHM